MSLASLLVLLHKPQLFAKEQYFFTAIRNSAEKLRYVQVLSTSTVVVFMIKNNISMLNFARYKLNNYISSYIAFPRDN